MAGLVGVSHGSSEWGRECLLVDIPPIEKVERVLCQWSGIGLASVWDVLTGLKRSMNPQRDKRTATYAGGPNPDGPDVFEQLAVCDGSRTPSSTHLVSLPASFHRVRGTLSHAQTRTQAHSRGCFGGMWDRAELALKEA